MSDPQDGGTLKWLDVGADDTPPWIFAFLLAPMASSSITFPGGSLEKKAVAAARAAEHKLAAKHNSVVKRL